MFSINQCENIYNIYKNITKTDVEHLLDTNNLQKYCYTLLESNKTKLLDSSNDNMTIARLFETYLYSVPNVFLVKRNNELLDKIKKYVKESIQSEIGLTPIQATVLMYNLLPPKYTQWNQDVPTQIIFPDDHHMHKEQYGWYFIVGNINTNTHKKYAVVLILWYFPIFPKKFLQDQNYSVNDFTCQFITYTLTDIHNQNFYKNNSGIVMYNTGLLHHSMPQYSTTNPIIYSSGKNIMKSQSENLNKLYIHFEDISTNNELLTFDCTLDAIKPYFLQGKDGCLPCIDRVGSLYYSYPRYQIEYINIKSNNVQMVQTSDIDPSSSLFWLDHQWTYQLFSESFVNNIFLRAYLNIKKTPSFNGWFWFLGHLQDGRDFTAVVMSKRLSKLPTHHETYENMGYTIINKDGSTEPFKMGTMVAKHWKSIHWNDDLELWVPTEWDLHFDDERFTLKSLYDSPIFENRTGDFVREGPVSIYKHKKIVGEGFSEMAGVFTNIRSYYYNKLKILGGSILEDKESIINILIEKPNDQIVISYSFFILFFLFIIFIILFIWISIKYTIKDS